MSPAVWIMIFFVVVLLGTPAVVLLLNEEPQEESSPGINDQLEEYEEEETTDGGSKPASEPPEPSNRDEEKESPEPTSDKSRNGENQTTDSGSTQDQKETDADADQGGPNAWVYSEKYETPVYFGEPNELKLRAEPDFNPDRQADYNDRKDPEPSSRRIQSAVDWLVEANTEAIHQQSKLNDFMDHLRAFVDEPRAAGAETIAQTPWRDYSPNMSRLIGERLLVMALSLSARGPYEMDAHKKAFRELLGEAWNDDGLDHPLVYQGIGRMGLLTPTPFMDLKHNLVERIPGRTPRSENPEPLEVARYHSLLLAVSPEEGYPFPKSDRGLSRLWHWDEHNPPLTNWVLLPTVLFSLWIHHASRETESDAANDFGALLGNWWDENEPESDFFRAKPGIWESLILTAWVLLPDHRLIWNQIEERYEELETESGGPLEAMTEEVFSWVDAYDDTGERPDNAPSRENLPPTEWIEPLPTTLLNDHSQPSFSFPEDWCDELTRLEHQREEPDHQD